jgi:hypothetical protein
VTITEKPTAAKKAKKSTSGYGGVSAKMRGPALQGFDDSNDLQPVKPISAAHPNFSYHGGPVIKCANVYTSFWGSGWLASPQKIINAGRLSQFMTDFLASKYMNILSQYGAGKGAGAAGLFFGASFVQNVANELTDTDIHSVIQSCIDAKVLPEPGNPSSMALMIFLDDAIAVKDSGNGIQMCEPAGDTAFGYHFFFKTKAGNPFYYSVIPGLTDACLKSSCGSSSCSLQLSESQEQRRTQVTSHEFSEMVTDPELNAWFDSDGSENGDICNGEPGTITVGANTWTVQRMYSKSDDVASNGATTCVLEEPNPIPELSPGPVSGLSLAAQMHLIPPGSLDRILPLPTRHFDVKTAKMTIDPQEARRYVDGLFLPLPPGAVVGDVHGFLDQLMKVLK